MLVLMSSGFSDRQQWPVAFSFFSFFKDQRAGELRTLPAWLCYSRRMKEMRDGWILRALSSGWLYGFQECSACGSSGAHWGGSEMSAAPAASKREQSLAKRQTSQLGQPHSQFGANTLAQANSASMSDAIAEWLTAPDMNRLDAEIAFNEAQADGFLELEAVLGGCKYGNPRNFTNQVPLGSAVEVQRAFDWKCGEHDGQEERWLPAVFLDPADVAFAQSPRDEDGLPIGDKEDGCPEAIFSAYKQHEVTCSATYRASHSGETPYRWGAGRPFPAQPFSEENPNLELLMGDEERLPFSINQALIGIRLAVEEIRKNLERLDCSLREFPFIGCESGAVIIPWEMIVREMAKHPWTSSVAKENRGLIGMWPAGNLGMQASLQLARLGEVLARYCSDRVGDPCRYEGLWFGILGVSVEGGIIPELPDPEPNVDHDMDYLTWLSRRIRQLLLDKRSANVTPEAGWHEIWKLLDEGSRDETSLWCYKDGPSATNLTFGNDKKIALKVLAEHFIEREDHLPKDLKYEDAGARDGNIPDDEKGGGVFSLPACPENQDGAPVAQVHVNTMAYLLRDTTPTRLPEKPDDSVTWESGFHAADQPMWGFKTGSQAAEQLE